MEELKEGYTYDKWTKLMELTLIITIQIFNRRRTGESERIFTENFTARQSIDDNVDREAFKRLSKKEQEYALKYVRFVVRGKRNRTVAVILQNQVVDYCLEIIRHQKTANVSDENEYLLEIPSHRICPKYLRACGLLRQFSEESRS